MRNFLLGTASLLIAVVLWLQVVSFDRPQRERELTVPLVIQSVPEGMVAVEAPETAHLLASGSPEALDGLDSGAFEAYVDAGQVRPGSSALRVGVRGPTRGGLTVRAMNAVLSLTFARTARVTKSVEVQETGLPPRDLVYEGAAITPDSVTLSGPDTSLSRVSRVRVVLDLSKVRPRSSFTLGVEALDGDGKPVPTVKADPEQVLVTPAVGAAPSSRRVIVNPTFVGQLPAGYRLERYDIRPSQVELFGPSGDLAAISSIDTEPISLEGVSKTTVREVNVVVPSGLKIKGQAVIRVTLVPEALPAPPSQPSPSTAGP